jgi:LmbE family N-acetylglucosaminyl deacetylase
LDESLLLTRTLSMPAKPRSSAVGPDAFAGTVLIAAPHMDDEILACGGLIARLPDKDRLHIVYATDGMRSPAPVLPWLDASSPELGALRREESRTAARSLGVRGENLHFLGLPEAKLRRHRAELARLLLERVRAIDPDHILMPFRYDRHPDHLEVNRVITAAKEGGRTRAALIEYFVYYRWRLLPGGDVRGFVRPEHLVHVDIGGVASRKRAALDCFKTQTTRYYAWQTRPILRPELLDEECAGPEQFLRYDGSVPGAGVFSRMVPWIRLAHRLEPLLQRWKYRIKSSFVRLTGRTA